MIGKNAGELRIPFARPDPQHQVVKAVIGFGYHQGHLGPVVAQRDAHRHSEFPLSEGDEGFGILPGLMAGCRVPLHPLKKDVFLTVEVLVGMQNVPAPVMNPTRNLGHDPRLIRPVKEGNDGWAHGW